MVQYRAAAVERAMKVQEVIMRAMAKQISWWQAAEILGVTTRTIRRMKRNWKKGGFDGLYDHRHHRPSPKRSGGRAAAGAQFVSRHVLGFQRSAFSRKIATRARDPLQLHVGEEGSANLRFGGN